MIRAMYSGWFSPTSTNSQSRPGIYREKEISAILNKRMRANNKFKKLMKSNFILSDLIRRHPSLIYYFSLFFYCSKKLFIFKKMLVKIEIIQNVEFSIFFVTVTNFLIIFNNFIIGILCVCAHTQHTHTITENYKLFFLLVLCFR